MPRIPVYTAPEQELRPSQTGAAALETAGRRINPLYQSIAENDRRAGEIQVQQYKELLWPRDILKLYEDRQKQIDSSKGSSKINVRFSNTGGVNGEGVGSTRGHAQVSRGAGALGSALSDGGYGLSSGTGTGYRPGSKETDYTGNQDYWGSYSYNPSPSQIAMDKYNTKVDAAVQSVTDQLVNTKNYWQQYYGESQYLTTPGQEGLTYDQYGNPNSATGVTPPPIPDSTSSGGFWSGLSSFISGTDGTSSSGDQSSTTDTGL